MFIASVLCSGLLMAPDAPKLEGILFGKPFQFSAVRVEMLPGTTFCRSNGVKDEAQVYVFSFQKGDAFMPENEIKFHVNVNVGTKWDKYNINQPAVKFGTPAYSKVYHGHTKSSSCGRGAMAMFITAQGAKGKSEYESASDMTTFKLTTKSLGNGKFSGTIYAYNAEFKSGVRGEFQFSPKKM